MSLILSGSEGLSDVDGTAATPAIRGTDTNTGIFFPAADTIAFAEGGAEVARFDSSGNLGIGTASPGARLQVEAAAGSGGGDVAIRLRDSTSTNTLQMIRTGATYSYGGMGGNEGALYSANTLTLCADSSGPIKFATNGSEQMRLTSTGLGIGTSSPATKLHVSGQSRVADSSNAANYMTFGVGANAPYGNASISTTTAGLAIVAEGAGNITFRNNGSEAMRIDSSGNLLVGTTSTTPNPGIVSLKYANGYVLNVGHASTAVNGEGFVDCFYNGNNIGGIRQSGTTGVSYATSSDYRLKENIQPMTGALAKVAALKPCTYNWKSDGSAGEGFIAHELAEVVPVAVVGEKDAVDAEGTPVYQGIDTSFLVATLTAAIQEQQAIIEQLKADVAALKGTA